MEARLSLHGYTAYWRETLDRVSRQSGLGTCEMSFIRCCMAFQCHARE